MGTYILLAGILATSIVPTPVNLSHGGTSTISDFLELDHVQSTPASPQLETWSAMQVWVTAYTSSPEETDDTPHITAMGSKTRDGVLATNMLPFGTKVRIPKFFGEKVFTVEDRMHPRKKNFMDVWMSEKKAALRFGIAYTEVLVLHEADTSDR